MTSEDLRAIDKRRMLANSERANDYWAENYAIDTLAMTVEIERLQAERDAARAEAAGKDAMIECWKQEAASFKKILLDAIKDIEDAGCSEDGLDGSVCDKWRELREMFEDEALTQPAPAASGEGK